MSPRRAVALGVARWLRVGAALALLGAASQLPGCGDCVPGTDGCPCLVSGACGDEGLACSMGVCQPRDSVCTGSRECAPANPKCFTPCKGDLEGEDGRVRTCSDEGLMEGCLSGMVCDLGSCVPESVPEGMVLARTPGTCGGDAECAEFQRCIDGRCYSDCDADTDCDAGKVCRKHTCRPACSDETPCVAGQVCESGVCMPTVVADRPALPPRDGDFELDTAGLDFTASVDEATLTLTNTADAPETFTIAKVEERHRDARGELVVIDGDTTGSPLIWLEMGVGTPQRVQSFPVTLDAGEEVRIRFAGARTPELSRWTGRLSVSTASLGVQDVALTYSEGAQGTWTGKVFYFGNFEDGINPTTGERPIDEWIADKANTGYLTSSHNALLQVWTRFRDQSIPLDEMTSLIAATLTGSWATPRVAELCATLGFDGAACAPIGGTGNGAVIPYTSDLANNPIPSGIVELDFAMNVRAGSDADVECTGKDHCLVGRIDSTESLQYAGDPAVTLAFEGDPLDCDTVGPAGCIARLSELSASIGVGGRYVPGPGDLGCSASEDFTPRVVPSLVPGFVPLGGLPGESPRVRRECRDTLLPLSGAALNAAFAGANPVPDARPRERTLSLVDGLMIDQQKMMLLVRETLDGFHAPGATLESYAYIALERQSTEPTPEELVGSRVEDARVHPTGVLDTRCAARLVGRVTDGAEQDLGALDAAQRADLAWAVTTGQRPVPVAEIDPQVETPHTLCVFREDAVVNSGSGIDDPTVVQREVFGAGTDGLVACPPGAQVIHFTLDNASFGSQFDPAKESCNQTRPETCLARLSSWVDTGRAVRLPERWQSTFPNAVTGPGATSFDLVVQCDTAGAATCDDRFDLTQSKRYLVGSPDVFFEPLESDVHQAFRYKTQFVSRNGASVGFAPTVCGTAADLEPYCYDPEGIERIVERVDCAVALYHDHLSGEAPLDDPAAAQLRESLEKIFSQLETENPTGDPIVEEGFERLQAELLIMLGDEAVTAAFGSRFDLAATQELSFPGSTLEVDGPDLSGVLGFEMYKLYQATEYYERVLDRFYGLVPDLWSTLSVDGGAQYLTQRTVTSYVDRVIRASTQSSLAWSEIARRYHGLNRAELARAVLERAYTRAYQESLVLTQLMDGILRSLNQAAVSQVTGEIERAQRRYRVAMLDMREEYEQVTDNVSFFGLRTDFIPFPALDEGDVNGFEVMFDRALQRLEVAEEHEAIALESRRDFDVDEAAFQGELVSIRNEFESQLGDLCGTFNGSDGRVHAAVPRFSSLDPDVAAFDDPCGAVGNGDIWLKAGDIQTRDLELQRVRQEIQNTLGAIDAAGLEVATKCRMLRQDVAAFLQTQNVVDNLNGSIASAEGTIAVLDRSLDFTKDLTDKIVTVAGIEGAPQKIAGGFVTGVWAALAATHLGATAGLEASIRSKETQIRDLERAREARSIGRECDYLQAELGVTIRELERELSLLELDVLNAVWNLQVDINELGRLDQERKRVEAEWEDADSLAINAAAAQTDPNVRIFKNAAMINADRFFELAAREAFKVTRIYEYFTGSSYAGLERLFLTRTAAVGELNLRTYLTELEDAFFEFEQEFGNPDTRVALISLQDDIFKIPRYSNDGLNRQLTIEERATLFREQLQSPGLLDDQGLLTVKFGTDFGKLSPRTVNHKILFSEVEIFGDTGDNVGRLYLSQLGTGTVLGTDGDRRFYAFPPRTAVMNPLFNGDRSFGQDSDGAITGPTRSIFRSARFRERPFVQTDWELVLNQRTEAVNQDINLAGLDDIVLSVFYTDFTPQQ